MHLSFSAVLCIERFKGFMFFNVIVFIFTLCLFSSLSYAADIKFVFTHESKRFEQLIEKFAEKEKIKIEKVWSAQGDLRVNLLELIEKGDAPDVVLIPSDHIGLHHLMNYSEIESSLRINERRHAPQNKLTELKKYGVPVIQGNHLMLYYNKQLVKKPAENWRMLAEQQKSLGLPAIVSWSYEEMYWLAPFVGAYGGQLMSNGNISLATPAMAKALNFYKKLKDDGLVKAACAYECSKSAFLSGEVPYTINGDWALKEFEQKFGQQLGIAVLPLIENETRPTSFYATHDLAFPNDSLNGEKREALLKLLAYFQSAEAQEWIWEEMRVLPVEKSTLDKVSTGANELEQQMILALEDAVAMPENSNMSIVWSALRKGFLRHQAGVMNAEDSAKLMQRIADKQRKKLLEFELKQEEAQKEKIKRNRTQE